uniref:WH2 domain-containing protein n=1 Tax=Ascaris lumbricoides TaxID=6252 RepID=A0A0M3HTQ5_ASCLU
MTVKKNTSKIPSSGGEVFDKILGSMVNPPKERKLEATKERDEAGPSGTSGSTRLQRGVRQLTREELERQHVDNSACYAFLRKDGLMERLLGHKMLTGRTGTSFDDFPKICEPPPVAIAVEERRGPRTPPGSPGHQDNSSLISSRGAASASPSSPPPPPPPEEITETKKMSGESTSLIAEMAELTKLPHSQLAECLGEELQNAMKQVDQAVLLNTLKDALIKVGRRNVAELDGSKASPEAKEECAAVARRPQSPMQISSPPVEMDIESDKSVETCEQVLPPPPPAPSTPPADAQLNANPTLSGPGPTNVPVPPPPCVLPTPPPPPPVVLPPAPPPQVIVSTAAAIAVPPTVTLVTAVSAPPVMIPPFSGPPPLPFVPTKPPPNTSAIHPQVCSSSVAPSIAASSAPSAAATPVAPTLPFAAPPPPVLPNTAVPPPGLPVAAFAAVVVPPAPICSREITGTINTSSISAAPPEPSASLLGPPPTSTSTLHPPPMLTGAPVAVVPCTSFLHSVAPLSLTPLTTSADETTAHLPTLTSQVDFSKPPPIALSVPPPAVQPPPSSQSMHQQPLPTYSVPPPVSALSALKPSAPPSSAGETHITSITSLSTGHACFSPSVSYSNGDVQRSFSEQTNVTPSVRNSPMPPVKETFFPAMPPHKNSFVRSERPPLVAAPPLQPPRPPLILAEQNPSTPTSQNVIRTLMSALAIPQQARSSPPAATTPQIPPGALINTAVCRPVDVSQPPPGGSIVTSRTSSPVLLDRYGCPLPVPAKRSGVMNRTQPHATMTKSILNSSNSESFQLKPVVNTMLEPSAEETPEEDSEIVDFSWPPANFEEQDRTKPNGNYEALSLDQPKFFSSPVQRPCTSLAGPAGRGPSPQVPSQKTTPRQQFPLPPPVDHLHAVKNALAGGTSKPPPLIGSAPSSLPPFRPPFASIPFRMRGQLPFPMRRPPPPVGPAQPGVRTMRPLFRR